MTSYDLSVIRLVDPLHRNMSIAILYTHKFNQLLAILGSACTCRAVYYASRGTKNQNPSSNPMTYGLDGKKKHEKQRVSDTFGTITLFFYHQESTL